MNPNSFVGVLEAEYYTKLVVNFLKCSEWGKVRCPVMLELLPP